MLKKKVEGETLPPVPTDTGVTQEDLLKQLAEERKKREALESEINEQKEKKKRETDPMSGVGKLCEATKITAAEAWQLRRRIINMPDGRQEMRSEPLPEGYQMRKGVNGNYIVGMENKDPLKCELIPLCRSKYTQEYTYKMKKPANFRIDQDPPEGKLHLCDHHAHVLLKKADCFCKSCNPPKKESEVG